MVDNEQARQNAQASEAAKKQQPATTTANAERANAEDGKPLNVVSEHTGQFDVRFLLWRTFCSETGISVDALPSELEGELRDRWDEMKDSQLHKPTEDAPTPPVTNK